MDIKELLNQEVTEQNAFAILEMVQREIDLGYVVGTYGTDGHKLSLIKWGKPTKTLVLDLVIPGNFVAVVKEILRIIAKEYEKAG